MITYQETELVSKSAYAQAIGLEVVAQNDFFRKLPMAMVQGAGLVYEREGTEPSVDWVAFGGAAPESGTAFRKVHTELANMANTVTTGGPAMRYMWDQNQIRTYTQKVIKAQIKEYLNRIWNGNRPASAWASALCTGWTLTTIGPNTRVGIGLIRCNVVGPVVTMQYQAPGDTTLGAASADIAALALGGTLELTSADLTSTILLTRAAPALPGATVDESITFTTATNQFDGLRRICPTTQVVDPTGVDGSPLALDYLRQVQMVVEADPSNCAWVTSRAGLRMFKKLQDSMNITPEYAEISKGRMVAAFDGIPFIVCDAIPSTLTKGASGATLTEYWLVGFGEANGQVETAPFSSDGVVGLYGGNASQELMGQNWLGFWMDDNLGKVTGFDQYELQVGADVGVALYSQKSLGCCRFIKTT